MNEEHEQAVEAAQVYPVKEVIEAYLAAMKMQGWEMVKMDNDLR